MLPYEHQQNARKQRLPESSAPRSKRSLACALSVIAAAGMLYTSWYDPFGWRYRPAEHHREARSSVLPSRAPSAVAAAAHPRANATRGSSAQDDDICVPNPCPDGPCERVFHGYGVAYTYKCAKARPPPRHRTLRPPKYCIARPLTHLLSATLLSHAPLECHAAGWQLVTVRRRPLWRPQRVRAWYMQRKAGWRIHMQLRL